MDTKELMLELFNASQIIVTDAGADITQTSSRDFTYIINLSDIASRMINEAGRWCKRYASDVIFTWDEVREKMNKHVQTLDSLEPDIVVFAFRKNGVDSNEYLKNRIAAGETIDYYYSEIYAVHIMDTLDDDGIKNVLVTLKNITSEAASAAFKNANNTFKKY